jgi:ABC-type glycerol-3-phosphate transport system substrate-binding protein
MRVRLFPLVAIAGLVLAACGSSTPSSSASKIGGSVSLWAEWSAGEQTSFTNALQPFESNNGVTVNYTSKGDKMDTALEAAVSGGAPPDVALSPSPATLQTLAKAGSIKDLTNVLGSLKDNFGSAWNDLATYNGKIYGVWFKAANKNTIWYNPAEFAAASISSPPTTWEQLIQDATTLRAAGITPFSLCTDIGWPVADLWQNVYLKTAGASQYNALAAHTVKWTDPSVTTAFTTLGQLTSNPANLAGGINGSISNSFPACVDKVFPKPGSMPQAAMVFEGDFVVTNITGNSPNYSPGTTPKSGGTCSADPSKTPCYDFFDFPAPSANSSNSAAVQGAGDVAMMLKDTPQAEALIKYLAGPQGASSWAHAGGFASPNKQVPLSTYPDSVSQKDAKALVNASSFVFSLDDLQKWEHDMWADLLQFVKSPSSVSSIEATMEQQATAAGP